MKKEKQIEEMAADIRLNMQIQPNPKEHPSHQLARLLVEDGYRKASSVTEEIFAEIEKSFIEYYEKTITYSSATLPLYIREAAGFSLNEMFMKIAELKKKYTHGEVNGVYKHYTANGATFVTSEPVKSEDTE